MGHGHQHLPTTLIWREKPWLLKCLVCNKTPLSRLKQRNSLAGVAGPLDVNNCQLICTKMYLYCKISNLYAQDVKPVHEEISIFNPHFLGLCLQQYQRQRKICQVFCNISFLKLQINNIEGSFTKVASTSNNTHCTNITFTAK